MHAGAFTPAPNRHTISVGARSSLAVCARNLGCLPLLTPVATNVVSIVNESKRFVICVLAASREKEGGGRETRRRRRRQTLCTMQASYLS